MGWKRRFENRVDVEKSVTPDPDSVESASGFKISVINNKVHPVTDKKTQERNAKVNILIST